MKKSIFYIFILIGCFCDSGTNPESWSIYGVWRVGKSINGIPMGYYQLTVVEEDPFVIDSLGVTADGHFTTERKDTAIVTGVDPQETKTEYGFYNLSENSIRLSCTRVRIGSLTADFNPPMVDLINFYEDGDCIKLDETGPDYYFNGITNTSDGKLKMQKVE